MDTLKRKIIVNLAAELKIATAIIMYATIAAILYDLHVDASFLPNYYHFSARDCIGWIAALFILGTANIIMIFYRECYRCRMVADLVLQLSGMLLLLMGWAFFTKYPPANIPMFFYPAWGIGMIVAGRHMGKRSREKYQSLQQ